MQVRSPAHSPSLFPQPQTSWMLRNGQVLRLRSRAAGVLRVPRGRAWITLDVDHGSLVSDTGDHFVRPGQDLALRAGQRVVVEAWPLAGDDAIALQWVPMAEQGVRSRWQVGVVEPLHDLGCGLAMVAGATLRLLAGFVRFQSHALGVKHCFSKSVADMGRANR